MSSIISTARWGHCQEGYGGDPYLQSECAKEYVQGLQYGPDKNHIEAIVSYMACSGHVYLYTSPFAGDL